MRFLASNSLGQAITARETMSRVVTTSARYRAIDGKDRVKKQSTSQADFLLGQRIVLGCRPARVQPQRDGFQGQPSRQSVLGRRGIRIPSANRRHQNESKKDSGSFCHYTTSQTLNPCPSPEKPNYCPILLKPFQAFSWFSPMRSKFVPSRA